MTHCLKCWPEYFNDIKAGIKTFEVRKNDRPFQVGHPILLQEYNPETNSYTGKEWSGTITYLMADTDFVKKGYVILGIKERE